MPTRPELEALLARVRKATEPDIGLSTDINLLLAPNHNPPIMGRPEHLARMGRRFGPHVTGSVDATLALVSRALPGRKAGFQPCIGDEYRGHILAVDAFSTALLADARGPTAPLAILAALLTAKIAEAGHG